MNAWPLSWARGILTPMSQGSRPASRRYRRPVAVDLFCGAGGMSLGFEQAGFDILAAVDNDPIHLATYSFNFPLAALVCADASSLDPDVVIRRAREGWARIHPGDEWDGGIDCVFGGPSCQGFSVIGKRDPKDKRNRLIDVFARLVAALEGDRFLSGSAAPDEGRAGLFCYQSEQSYSHRRLCRLRFCITCRTWCVTDRSTWSGCKVRASLGC